MVVSFGVHRSGSTWVWQILAELFGRENVPKTHGYWDHRDRRDGIPDWFSNTTPVFCTCRDYRDCVVSYYRTRNPKASTIDSGGILYYAKAILRDIEALNRYIAGGNAHLIRYELAIERPSLIFDIIRQGTGRFTTTLEQDRILSKHSIEANRKLSQEGKGLDWYVTKNHVQEGAVGTWRRFVDEAGEKLLMDLLREPLLRYGYLKEQEK